MKLKLTIICILFTFTLNAQKSTYSTNQDTINFLNKYYWTFDKHPIGDSLVELSSIDLFYDSDTIYHFDDKYKLDRPKDRKVQITPFGIRFFFLKNGKYIFSHFTGCAHGDFFRIDKFIIHNGTIEVTYAIVNLDKIDFDMSKIEFKHIKYKIESWRESKIRLIQMGT